MLLFGFIWAALAPFLLSGLILGAGILIYKVSKPIWKHWIIPVSLLLIASWTAIGIQYYTQLDQFIKYTESIQIIHPDKPLDISNDPKIILESQTANSFGYRYVKEGFNVQMKEYPTTKNWIEAQYFNGEYKTTKIDGPDAKYKIQEVHEEGHYWSTGWTKVYKEERIIAQDALVNFKPKGLARWSLGAWGSASYPSVVSQSQRWREAYYLGCWTLLNKSLDACAGIKN